MLEPFLEGQTMDAALAANRIFIVDLEILSRLKLDENKKVGKISEWVSPRAPKENILIITDNMMHLTTFFVCFFPGVHSFGII